MYRVSIKIESIRTVIRGRTDAEPTPDLLVEAKGIGPAESIRRAIRILSGELEAIELDIQGDLNDDEEKDSMCPGIPHGKHTMMAKACPLDDEDFGDWPG